MRQVYCEDYDDRLSHDYNLLTVQDETILVRSDNEDWTPDAQEEIVATLEDSGDGIQIRADFLDDHLTLDYAQARELAILLINNLDSKVEIRESITLKKF